MINKVPLKTVLKIKNEYSGKLIDLTLNTGEIVSGILLTEEYDEVKKTPVLLSLIRNNGNKYSLCLYRTDVEHDVLSFIDLREVNSININI